MIGRRLSALLTSLLFLSGCAEQRHPYYGPTLTLDALVSAVNANNSQLPTLWARQDFDANIIDSNHQSHAGSARGVLLYRAPDELRIVANDDFGQLAFEIGATSQYYWLKVVPGSDKLWWGKMVNAGKPCSQAMPVRPDLILDVLAIATIHIDIGNEPYSVMRFDNDDDAYIVDSIVGKPGTTVVHHYEICQVLKESPTPSHLTTRPTSRHSTTTQASISPPAQQQPTTARCTQDDFALVWSEERDEPSPGQLLLRKEVWYDRQTLQPRRVALFDDNGREALRATLGDFSPVAGAGATVATRYDLLFPESGTTMRLVLRDQALGKNGIPRPGSIHLPDLARPGVKTVVQIDKDCD
jgi:hypothetical protein